MSRIQHQPRLGQKDDIEALKRRVRALEAKQRTLPYGVNWPALTVPAGDGAINPDTWGPIQFSVNANGLLIVILSASIANVGSGTNYGGAGVLLAIDESDWPCATVAAPSTALNGGSMVVMTDVAWVTGAVGIVDGGLALIGLTPGLHTLTPFAVQDENQPTQIEPTAIIIPC